MPRPDSKFSKEVLPWRGGCTFLSHHTLLMPQGVTYLLWLSPFGGVPVTLIDTLRYLSVTKLLMKGKRFTRTEFFLLYSVLWVNCVLSGAGQSVSWILMYGLSNLGLISGTKDLPKLSIMWKCQPLKFTFELWSPPNPDFSDDWASCSLSGFYWALEVLFEMHRELRCKYLWTVHVDPAVGSFSVQWCWVKSTISLVEQTGW